ncbi:TIGR00725 family protein [Ornithinimicrobium kibberense]|uniref:TIGR00725 family protein n=1 Tax=Ornithinimicrobium kibberense TaxID=282060 RepID=A0ABV5V3D0_9MICO|nr:TIGR00725 family protein [Ornithinimicrobium kibberense]
MPTSPVTPADRPQAYVGVVGPGAGATADQVEQARELGRSLAERGLVLVTGGLDGVMDAAAAGCDEVGGVSIGLLPGSDRTTAGPHHAVTVPTGLGELRNGLVVRASHAVVAVGPSWGTLSEVALACRTGVPVVLLGWPEHALEGIGGSGRPPVRASSVTEAVDLVLGVLRRSS